MMMSSVFDTGVRWIVMCGWSVHSWKHAFWPTTSSEWSNIQLFVLDKAWWQSNTNSMYMQPTSYAYPHIILRPEFFCILVWERRNESLTGVRNVRQSQISSTQNNQQLLSIWY